MQTVEGKIQDLTPHLNIDRSLDLDGCNDLDTESGWVVSMTTGWKQVNKKIRIPVLFGETISNFGSYSWTFEHILSQSETFLGTRHGACRTYRAHPRRPLVAVP